jgi:hypothetical protein
MIVTYDRQNIIMVQATAYLDKEKRLMSSTPYHHFKHGDIWDVDRVRSVENKFAVDVRIGGTAQASLVAQFNNLEENKRGGFYDNLTVVLD